MLLKKEREEENLLHPTPTSHLCSRTDYFCFLNLFRVLIKLTDGLKTVTCSFKPLISDLVRNFRHRLSVQLLNAVKTQNTKTSKTLKSPSVINTLPFSAKERWIIFTSFTVTVSSFTRSFRPACWLPTSKRTLTVSRVTVGYFFYPSESSVHGNICQ